MKMLRKKTYLWPRDIDLDVSWAFFLSGGGGGGDVESLSLLVVVCDSCRQKNKFGHVIWSLKCT